MTYHCRGCNEPHRGNNPALSIEIDPDAGMDSDESYDWCVRCAATLLDEIRAWAVAHSGLHDPCFPPPKNEPSLGEDYLLGVKPYDP